MPGDEDTYSIGDAGRLRCWFGLGAGGDGGVFCLNAWGVRIGGGGFGGDNGRDIGVRNGMLGRRTVWESVYTNPFLCVAGMYGVFVC